MTGALSGWVHLEQRAGLKPGKERGAQGLALLPDCVQREELVFIGFRNFCWFLRTDASE